MASTTAQVSLTNTTTGTGASIDFTTAKKTVTAVIIVSGTITGGVCTVEASQDDTNWVPLGSASIDQGRNREISFAGRAFRYWRGRVSADVSGGGRVAVTFMEAD